MGRKRDAFAVGRNKLVGIAAVCAALLFSLHYFREHLRPPPSPPPPAPLRKGMTSSDPLRVELFCGNDLCAYTWEKQPGVVAVTSASGKETAQNVFQSFIDTRAGTSMLPYITSMAERACKEFPNGNGLLIGLGGGAFPLILRKACPEGPHLTVVDASADALFIARTFVVADDGRLTTFVTGLGQDFVAASKEREYDFVINDAYEGMHLVSVLMEEAFVKKVHAALRPRGVYAINVLGDGLNDKVAKTVEGVFGEADKMRVEGTMNTWVLGYRKEPPAEQ